MVGHLWCPAAGGSLRALRALVADPVPNAVTSRLRLDDGFGLREHTFTAPPATRLWEVVDTAGGLRVRSNFEGPDESRAQVAPVWTMEEWHWVQVVVREEAGTIEVPVDGDEAATLFAAPSLGSSTHVGTSDVRVGGVLASGRGVAFYDDVAVFPLVEGTGDS